MSVIRNILNSTKALVSNSLPTTGSNTFVGTQTLSGSIIPAIDNTYDLGSATYQWRDIYVSSGSLYIDGTKVLGSTGNELQITTDVGQSIKILEAGSDSIILQSADGDIQLKTSGGGNLLFDPTTGLIDVRGTLQIQDGNKITSSGGNGIVFGNNIVVSGSLESTGNINGINLTTFSSSIASTFLNQNSATSSYETKGRGLVSGSSQITYADISSIPSGIVSGSSQITLSSTTGFSTYSTSVDSRITTEKGRVDAILLASDADKDTFTEIVALINSVDTSNDSTFASFYTASVNRLNNLETTSGSVNISISNINTATSSYETKGRSIVSGSSQITYANISSIPGGIVSGSSQITFSGITSKPTTISGYGITDALNNATGSEQTIGFRYGQINNSDKTIKFDPRWNESGYDADLGTLHIYSTTAAGANYGRTGIALYHGSAYQYLTTKASTTGLFVNNSLIATAGSSPTFANVKGSSYFDAQASSGFRIRNSDDTVNAGGFTRRGLWEGNANYDPAMWAETGYGLYFYSNGSGTARAYFDTSGHFVPGANNTYNLGSASFRWANLYTNDLHLSNEGKVGGNEVDGTTGNWTIQEGEEHLYIINNKTGKKFKFSLEEIQ